MDPVSPSSARNMDADDSISQTLSLARKAQREWSETSVPDRLCIVAATRRLVAEAAVDFARLSAQSRGRPTDEALTAEILPLLEAHRFLEKRASGLLAEEKLGASGRPGWLSAVQTEIRREPRGVVLVIGPRNYPLMLPGIQVAQALAAGNAVLWKPAPGTGDIAARLARAWREARLPAHLLTVLPESVDKVTEALDGGVNFVVLTGGAGAGEAVYRACAARLIPAVMELSGCDAVIVRADADIALAAEALSFGLRLNGGETCIAPRRAFISRRVAEQLEAHLVSLLEGTATTTAKAPLDQRLHELLNEVAIRGGSVVHGGNRAGAIQLPLVISGGASVAALVTGELFGSVLALTFVDIDEEAIALAGRSAHALGASIFSSDIAAARKLAGQLNAGVVVINDMIVPTADPRIPFGGRNGSGFGVTRGAEGLLTMTVPKVVTVTRGRRRRHFETNLGDLTGFFAAYIRMTDGAVRKRWTAMQELWRELRAVGSKRARASKDDQHEQI